MPLHNIDLHTQDSPLGRGYSLPANMTIGANGEIVVVQPGHEDHSVPRHTELVVVQPGHEDHSVPRHTEVDEENQGEYVEEPSRPEDYQTNARTMLQVIEGGHNLPVTLTIASSNQTNSNVQVISNEGSGEQSIILSYPSSVVEQSNNSCDSTEGSDLQKSCLICGDKGSGFHYSAFSCEGCKGFFKRTVQKTLAYNCKGNGECVINKYTRNSCQHCRFQRCLEVGMKREAVREDRSPGGKHRHKRLKLDNSPVVSSERFTQSSPAIKPSFQDPLLDSLVQAKPFLIPRVEGHISLDSLSINELMQYGYMELRYIIEWAKKVPGFKSLGVDDQMALLKSAFMELNVLRLSYRSLDMKGFIKFAEGLTVPIDYATSIGWGKELITATADFATRLRDILMDETEFSTLNAIVLTYPDAIGIQNKQQVTGLQTKMLDSLRKYINHTYPDDHRRYGKMLLRLPALRTVSAKAAERFMSLTLDGNIQLSALVSEMMS